VSDDPTRQPREQDEDLEVADDDAEAITGGAAAESEGEEEEPMQT
jgi:hypothetical protein